MRRNRNVDVRSVKDVYIVADIVALTSVKLAKRNMAAIVLMLKASK